MPALNEPFGSGFVFFLRLEHAILLLDEINHVHHSAIPPHGLYRLARSVGDFAVRVEDALLATEPGNNFLRLLLGDASFVHF